VTVWIKDGEVVDPRRGVRHDDLIVEKGRVAGILPRGAFRRSGEGVRVIDASGKLVLPGLVDMHVHLREPGEEYKETVSSGCRAAVAGGVTAVACMPNTVPPNDCRAVTEFILKQAAGAGTARVYPIACITAGQQGKTLTEFGDLAAAGAVGVSDDGLPVADSEVMRRALEYGRFHGLTVISHCEDRSLSEGGVMHEGVVSTRIGLPGIPAACEEIMVCRDISLARLTGCPVHVAHVSTAGAVALIRRAKEEGVPVTCETAPHYFTLDHEAVAGYDTRTKVNPPLRTPEDVAAIRQGLADGTIDAIATDHAPHSPLEKELEFDRAAFGMIGLDTFLPLVLQLVRDGVLDLPEAVRKCTLNPSVLLGIEGGGLEEGSRADLTLVDPEMEYRLREEDLVSKSKNSPFIGMTLKGRAVLTMVGGRIVWERDGTHPDSR